MSNLKIIAKTTSEDKRVLVTGLRELKNVVGITGDETEDSKTLLKA